MVKIKIIIAFTFAMIACVLTIFSALAEHARLMTILYRMGVSMFLVGVLGYIAANFMQPYIEQKLIEQKPEGQKTDISQTPLNDSDEGSQAKQDAQFSPLTAEKLDRITTAK
ncbi:putative phage tail protein [Sporomusaceae bacterium BoRhaA]|uniref:hypothetical protein n=1 Tax=Pelorhabdus rhamnosifermentans TaxID=2772457 RepID=UPI001C063670|nr:hypothetical protein [Pelorhabdus rhamnosifermentans]MBU2701986.1 putative phage tail protein [Pelorhabdus rhamnosifermentans]